METFNDSLINMYWCTFQDEVLWSPFRDQLEDYKRKLESGEGMNRFHFQETYSEYYIEIKRGKRFSLVFTDDEDEAMLFDNDCFIE